MNILPFGLDSVFTDRLADITLGQIFGAMFFIGIMTLCLIYLLCWIYAFWKV